MQTVSKKIYSSCRKQQVSGPNHNIFDYLQRYFPIPGSECPIPGKNELGNGTTNISNEIGKNDIVMKFFKKNICN